MNWTLPNFNMISRSVGLLSDEDQFGQLDEAAHRTPVYAAGPVLATSQLRIASAKVCEGLRFMLYLLASTRKISYDINHH